MKKIPMVAKFKLLEITEKTHQGTDMQYWQQLKSFNAILPGF